MDILENGLLNPVHDLEVPIQQDAAIDDSQQVLVRVKDGSRGLEHHAGGFFRLWPHASFGRTDEFEVGLVRQRRRFPMQVFEGDNARGSHRFTVLNDGPDEFIARLVVAHLARVAGAQQHPAMPVGDRQHVELLPFPRPAKRSGGWLGVTGQQRIHEQHTVGGEPHGIVNRRQFVQVDLARRIEISLHFGLRFGYDPIANDLHPDDAENPAREEDNEQEAQH